MKVEYLIPEVYYKESRDFAYIGRLFEVIFNYMKTSADCVNVNIDKENVDSNLIDLLANTLGFELKHPYINKDLVVVASAFSTLLKNKGTIYAVNLAVRLLLNSQGIKISEKDFDFCILPKDFADTYEVNINIPENLTDIVLLEDLLDYILPVGVTYKLTKFGDVRDFISAGIDKIESNVVIIDKKDTELGIIECENTDIGYYPPPTVTLTFEEVYNDTYMHFTCADIPDFKCVKVNGLDQWWEYVNNAFKVDVGTIINNFTYNFDFIKDNKIVAIATYTYKNEELDVLDFSEIIKSFKLPANVKFINGEEASGPNDTLIYWYVEDADWNCGSVVKMNKAEYKDDEVTLSYVGGSVDHSVQLFYKSSVITAGTYKLTLNINASVAGTCKVNGKVINLVAGDNAVEAEYTVGSGSALSIQFNGSATEVTYTISNVKWNIATDALLIKNEDFVVKDPGSIYTGIVVSNIPASENAASQTPKTTSVTSKNTKRKKKIKENS